VILTEMATQNPRHCVVFVAWNSKQKILWKQLGELLEELPGIQGEYQLASWDSAAGANPGERDTPKQRLLAPARSGAHRFLRYLHREPYRVEDEHSDPEITLVAHGKACRVVQQYLLDLLEETEEAWRDRRRVRQAIFLSPSQGKLVRLLVAAVIGLPLLAILSEVVKLKCTGYAVLLNSIASVAVIASGLLGGLLPLLLSSESLKKIGWAESFDKNDLDKQFDELIIGGSKRRAGTWPIPSQILSIPRLTPTTDTAETIADAIRKPKGHKNVYELAMVKIETKVAPIQPPVLPPGAGQRDPFDNRSSRGEIHSFSERDATAGNDLPPYQLRYQTHGYMEIQKLPMDNLWSVQEQGLWNAHHQSFIYAFRPEPGDTYALDATIYGGFNAGDRTAHTHIDVTHYIQKLEYTLDLRGYLTAGWAISRPPELYYFPPRPPEVRQKDRIFLDETCDCLSTQERLPQARPLQIATKEPGLYQWAVYSIRNGGIIGFVFDVSPRHQAPP
jgi:hypothetical protein